MALGEVVAEFIDNMPEEEIDKNLKEINKNLRFFGTVAEHFELPTFNYVAMVCSGDEDYLLMEEYIPEEVKAFDPVFEECNGNRYLYFKSMEDAEKAVEIIEKHNASVGYMEIDEI